jgi:hypothetical protein
VISPVVDDLTYSFYAITKEGGFFIRILLNQPILNVASRSFLPIAIR